MSLPIESAREKLIRCGRMLLLRDGYRSMRIQDLTAACGMASGTFYSYYKSKAELAVAIVQTDWDAMLARMDTAVSLQVTLHGQLSAVFETFRGFSDIYFYNWIQFGADLSTAGYFKSIKSGCLGQLAERIGTLLQKHGALPAPADPSADKTSLMIAENLLVIARSEVLSFDAFESALEKWLFRNAAADTVPQQNYAAERKRYEAAVLGADLTVWEYHIREHRIIGNRYSPDKLNLTDIRENVPDSLLSLVAESDRERFLEMYREVNAGLGHVSGEFWMAPADGKPPKCERVVYTVEKDSTGSPAIAYGVSIDITAQRREQLHFRQAVQEIFADNPEALCHFAVNLTQNRCFDGQGKSPDIVRMIRSDTVDGMFANIGQLIPDPQQRAEFAETFSREKLIRNFEAGSASVSLAYERADRPGEVKSVMTSLRMIRNPKTSDITGAFYSVDITQKKELNDILRIITSEEHQMVSLLDLGSRRIKAVYLGLDMPDSYRKLFGKSGDTCGVEDLKRNSTETWLHPEDRQKYAEATDVDTLPERLRGTGHFDFTVRSRPAGQNGEVAFRKFQYFWLDDRHIKVLVVMSDITDGVRSHQEELEKERELRRKAASANAAKTDFLSRMSHDIRTPLNGISGMVYLAKQQNNPAKTQDCLDKIETSSRFLLGLINEILDMTNAENGVLELHPEPYTPDTLHDYLSAVIQPLCDEKGIRFIYDNTETVRDVVPVADILRVNQVYFNLLSNAVKFTPEGGTVTCRLRSHLTASGRLVSECTVSDNGIGIGREFQDQLFDSFAQESRNDADPNRGFGLGLAIVRRIVDAMHGTISVKSEPGAGSTFTVTIETACVPAGQTVPVQDQAGTAADRLNGIHVLLCEDHPLNQEITRALLQQKGAVVTIAEDGQKGVELFRASGTGFYDIILMDIRMPLMDGYQAAAEIRKLPREDAAAVPIIALTANTFADDIRKCSDAGMNGHLSKPIDPDRMFTAMAAALKSGRPKQCK